MDWFLLTSLAITFVCLVIWIVAMNRLERKIKANEANRQEEHAHE